MTALIQERDRAIELKQDGAGIPSPNILHQPTVPPHGFDEAVGRSPQPQNGPVFSTGVMEICIRAVYSVLP